MGQILPGNGEQCQRCGLIWDEMNQIVEGEIKNGDEVGCIGCGAIHVVCDDGIKLTTRRTSIETLRGMLLPGSKYLS